MTWDDDLRRRLAAADPTRAEMFAPLSPQRRQELVMQITDSSAQPTPQPAPQPGTATPSARRPGWRRPVLVAAGGLLAFTVAVGVSVSRPTPPAPTSAAPPLALTVPAGAASMMCMVFDVAILKEMPVAFAGTVTSIADGTATVRIDKWYKGDTGAATATVPVPREDLSALIGTPNLEQGESYLLSAGEDGMVSACGYSGLRTPELERSFDAAFAG